MAEEQQWAAGDLEGWGYPSWNASGRPLEHSRMRVTVDVGYCYAVECSVHFVAEGTMTAKDPGVTLV